MGLFWKGKNSYDQRIMVDLSCKMMALGFQDCFERGNMSHMQLNMII